MKLTALIALAFFDCFTLLLTQGCAPMGAAQRLAVQSGPNCQDDRREVQVAFATDRNLQFSPDGRPQFGTDRSDETSFGIAKVNFHENRQIGSLPAQQPSAIELYRSPTAAVRQLLAEHAREQVGLGPKILIFVHGFGEDFASSVSRAAQVVHDGCLDVIPVLFSWPTTRQFTDYAFDRDSAVFARNDLAKLILDLSRSRPQGRIDVFAHSMGNWVALESFRIIADEERRHIPIFDTVVLASADVDIDVFRKDLPYAEKLARQIVVISSPQDITLRLSKMLAGNVPRTGGATLGEFQAHGIGESVQLKIETTENLCNPLVHRCTEVTKNGLQLLRSFLPSRQTYLDHP